MHTKKSPLVSIGMTVFNAAMFLTKAIESLLLQDYENFEIVISDNASEDGSSEICQDFAKRNNRIRYFRNRKNMGPNYNSQKAVSYCSGEFLMVAADHDIYHPSFITTLINIFDKDETVVLAYPLTTLIDKDEYPIELMADRIDTRGMDICQRFSKVIWESSAMNMVYGIYRMPAFKEAMNIGATIGPDLAMMAKLSLIGTIAQIKQPLFFRRQNRNKETVQDMTQRQVGWFIKSDIKALVPWTMLAFTQIKIIRDFNFSAKEKEILLTDIKNCYRHRFGTLMLNEIKTLLKHADQVISRFSSYPSLQIDSYFELIQAIEIIKYFFPEILELNQFDTIKSQLCPINNQQLLSSIKPYYQSCSIPNVTNKKIQPANLIQNKVDRSVSDLELFPALQTIFFFLSNRQAYRSILFSTNEIFCGPDCETQQINDLYKTIKTPLGSYDVRGISSLLSSKQYPEVIIVKADATRRNFPTNLKVFTCPKVLILGNTQHLDSPIQTLLSYALKEQFDFITSDHKRHHLHFFKEAGFEKIFWLPGINIFPHEQPYVEEKLYDISFVGQVGKWHPYRKTVLQFLQTNGIAVNIIQAPHEKAAEIYSKSLINLNISLNGDLNLRVFEVLSSGGFLLTDRLSKESGLEMIFKDGEHLVCYDNLQDLVEKIRYYLKHPAEARAIARKGYEEYLINHTPEKKTNELMEYIYKGRMNPLYDVQKDSRSTIAKSQSMDELFRRISIYEYFQNVHLTHQEIKALFFPSVDPCVICDVIDLPRLRLYLNGNVADISNEKMRFFNDAGVADRIHAISPEDIKRVQVSWDIVVLNTSDLVEKNLEDIIMSINLKFLIFSDCLTVVGESNQNKIVDFLLKIGFEKIQKNPDVFHWKDKSLWGEHLFLQGQTALAVKNFEYALQDNPTNENALNNLGVISFQLTHNEAAEKFLLKVVSLNRYNVHALNNLVQLYIKTERFEEVVGLLREVTTIDPERAESWYLLGFCQERLNLIKESYYSYQKARSIDEINYPTPEGIIASFEKLLSTANNEKFVPISKHILVINNLYPPQAQGEYENWLLDVVNILNERGHTIHVLTSNISFLGMADGNESNIDRSLQLLGVWKDREFNPIDNKKEINRINSHNTARIDNVIKECNADVCLIGNMNFLSRNILDIVMDKKIPIIHHLCNDLPNYDISDTPKNRLYHLATASSWLKNKIIRSGYPIQDISIARLGAFVDDYRMRIPPAIDQLRIVFTGAILPQHGPHILINALKKIYDMGIKFSCLFAGNAPDENFINKLKLFVFQTGMENMIQFTGDLNLNAKKQLFARHNIIVFPSCVNESFAINHLEAMAAGLTIVTSDTGVAKEIIEHGVNGAVFKPEDDSSLSKELIQLMNNPENWRKISIAGQRRALDIFDINMSVDAIESCFDKALKKSDPVISLSGGSNLNVSNPISEGEKPHCEGERTETVMGIGYEQKAFNSSKIIVDGVFFQMYRTGIARVWKSLLLRWANTQFGDQLLLLDRNGTSPEVAGLRYRRIAAYDYSNTDADRAMLQHVCDEENAAVFISTYYTTPLTTPSVFMGYDMIPEVAGWDTNHPMWREKQYGIRHATRYIVISQNTADDLRRFFPDITAEQITVAHTGVDFSRPSDKAIKTFKKQFGINKPYWLLVGGRGGYKNSILFFKAFAKLKNHRRDFAIVCTGPTGELEAEYAALIGNAAVFMLDLSDDDLQAAYAAAIALVYPSLYEGFGMPIIEAMACGCPVITSPSGSIPEVAGDAALLVNTSNVDEMLNAMKQVQKPQLRRLLIDRGMLRTRLYSWDKMADEVKNVLLRVIAER